MGKQTKRQTSRQTVERILLVFYGMLFLARPLPKKALFWANDSVQKGKCGGIPDVKEIVPGKKSLFMPNVRCRPLLPFVIICSSLSSIGFLRVLSMRTNCKSSTSGRAGERMSAAKRGAWSKQFAACEWVSSAGERMSIAHWASTFIFILLTVASERTNECAQQSARVKRAVQSNRMSGQCQRTSDRRSERPSTLWHSLCVPFIFLLPIVHYDMMQIAKTFAFHDAFYKYF